MDEFRKEKRRKDFSDSEDDDDPFHNKSAGFGGFGSPAKGRGTNATPTSIRADSIAGKSRATSTTKAGGGGPMNVPGAPAGKG